MADEETQKPTNSKESASAATESDDESKEKSEKADEKEGAKTESGDGEKKGAPIVSGETELEEKQVKRAFLSKFRKKKTSGKKTDGKVAETSAETGSSDEVAERIYQQLAHNETQEYFVFKFKKKKVLGFFGLIIFVLWVGFFVNFFMEARGLAYPWETDSSNESQDATASADIVTEDDTGVRIRIRNITGDEEGAVQLAQFLQSRGYTAVEVLEDTESEFDGVAIVVKADDTEIRAELEPIVEELYVISSPSAELTADSDFDAVILYAPAERAANGGASAAVQQSDDSNAATTSSQSSDDTEQ